MKPNTKGAGIRRASGGRALSVKADDGTLRRLEYAAEVVQYLTGTRESNATLVRAALRLLVERLSQHLECANPHDRSCREVGMVRVMMNNAARGESVRMMGWPASLTDESGEVMTLSELHEAARPRGRFGGLMREDAKPFEGELTGEALDNALGAELRKVVAEGRGHE